jgi:hypothetical protein
MPRTTTIPGLCAALALAACGPADEGEWIAPGAAETRNGVTMQQVPLAQLRPAVPAGDPEQGRCEVSHRQPSGVGFVQMRFPAAPGDVHEATLMLDASGGLRAFNEMRRVAGAMTSVDVNVPEGTGGATNVTADGVMTIGKGTADEALRSAALGNPARTIERMLARCGRPGATKQES